VMPISNQEFLQANVCNWHAVKKYRSINAMASSGACGRPADWNAIGPPTKPSISFLLRRHQPRPANPITDEITSRALSCTSSSHPSIQDTLRTRIDMTRTLLTAVILLGVSLPGYAREEQLAKGYAVAFATATYASSRCAGLSVDEGGLSALKKAAGLDDGDDSWLAQEINHAKLSIETAFETKGAREWCGLAWALFGPESVGILQKQNYR
jgi:hypothetical protein